MSNGEHRTKFEKLVEEKGPERALNLFAKLKPDLLGPEAGVVEFSIPTWLRLYYRETPTFRAFNKNAWGCVVANINALDDSSQDWCEALQIIVNKWGISIPRKLRNQVITNAIDQARTIDEKKLIVKACYRIDDSLKKKLGSKISKIFDYLLKNVSSWNDCKFVCDFLLEHRDHIEEYESFYERALNDLIKHTLLEKDLTDSIWQQTVNEYAPRSKKHKRKIDNILLKRIKTIEECEPYMPGSFNACSGPTSLMKAVTLKACKIAKTDDEITFVIEQMEFYRLCENHSKKYTSLLNKSAKLIPKDIPDAWGHWKWLYSKARKIGSKRHEELALKKIKELDKLCVDVHRAKPMLILRLREWDWLRKYGGGLQLYAEKKLIELITSISEDHQPSWEFRVAWEFALDNFTEEYPIREKAQQMLFAML